MNTKPSKITLKIYLGEISPHGPRLGFHENYLLADYFALTSLRILGKFVWNFFKNAQINLWYRPPPLNKNGAGRGGGAVYTGYQSSASTGYSVSDVTGK